MSIYPTICILLHIFINILVSQCRRLLLRSITTPVLSRPAKTGPRPRHRRSGRLATLSTSLGPPSEDEAGTHDEAVSESDLREADDDSAEADVDLDDAGAPEAGARQSSASPPRFWPADVARLHAQIELLEGRLAMARFDSRGSATTNGPTTHRLLAWKPGSIRSLPADTLPMDKPWSLLSLRHEVLTGSERTPSCSGSLTRSGS